MQNTKVVLAKRPAGQAAPDCFRLETEETGDLLPGQVRVAVEYISVDAGTRTMLRGEGFHHQVGLDEVILAGGVGRVIESNAEEFSVGDAVRGGLGAQTVATVKAEHLEKLQDSNLPLSTYLGALGSLVARSRG